MSERDRMAKEFAYGWEPCDDPRWIVAENSFKAGHASRDAELAAKDARIEELGWRLGTVTTQAKQLSEVLEHVIEFDYLTPGGSTEMMAREALEYWNAAIRAEGKGE